MPRLYQAATFLPRWTTCLSVRPVTSIVECRAATMIRGHEGSANDHKDLDPRTLAVLAAVAPGIATGGGGSGTPCTTSPAPDARPAREARRMPPGVGAFLPRRMGGQSSGDDQVTKEKRTHADREPATNMATTDLDSAVSTIREELLADVARVVAESPVGSSKGCQRRGSRANTRRSRSKGNKGRHHGGSTSSSSSGSSSASPLSS